MRYVRAYTYDTADPTYNNLKGAEVQRTEQWYALVSLLYKLGICVVY